ncbi:MAG: 30S ribosomal protein S3 [Methanomassiliicoccales archaeon]|nr:30S ribosomal protein S3 [Methanomassiliicoccales archaeon]
MASERKFVAENIRRVLLKEYLMKTIDRAGFGGVDVQRTPMGTRVTLVTERPGIVIGRRGAAIKSLTKAIEDNFHYDNPQIEVQEVENPNLNAQIMAEKLAFALERGWHFRRAGHSTVRRIMESGARGCLIIISGKLTGERHRTEKFKEGSIKYCGETRNLFIGTGFAVAKLKPGVIGVQVEIMQPDARLPAEIDVMQMEAAIQANPDLADLLCKQQEASVIVEHPADEAPVDETKEVAE